MGNMSAGAVAHYRILAKLGEGGMGQVYLSEDLRLHRKVALKVLAPRLASQPRNVERFQREARSAASLNHPNIVTIYSVEEADGLHFLTMELVEGEPLSNLIPVDGLPLPRCLEIATALCEGLAAAHAQGLVHRDLKPANVMVTREGRIKILDFGIAKLLSDTEKTVVEVYAMDVAEELPLTEFGKVLGTAPYMSPEQILGRPVDHRSDLFSFGVLLCEMATGHRPFAGGTDGEVVAAILRDRPCRPSSLRPDLPEGLDGVVTRCLEKDPQDRYANASEVLADLRALLAGVGERSTSRAVSPFLSAPSIPPPRTQPRKWRRRTAAVTLLFVIAATALLSWSLTRERGAASSASREIPSLAVLPLDNLSGDPEYFVDGMTDALIASLGNLRGVRVISRQSAMRYRGSEKPLPEIAKELGVGMILEGAVLRSRDQVRVTAQLVRALPEEQIWSASYQRELRDILELQGELAQDIAQKIAIELSARDRLRLSQVRPVEPAAFDACLRGRYFWNKRTPEGFRLAIRHFEEAIERDPTYAPAYAGLADTYCLLGFNFVAPKDAFSRAEAAARKALEIDPSLAEAYASLGGVELFYQWNWDAAERSFQRALDLNPSYSTAHLWYWALNAALDRRDSAAERIRLARELDPLSLVVNNSYGLDLLFKGRPQQAIAEFDKTITLDARFAPAYFNRWLANASLARESAALGDHVALLRLMGFGEAAVAAENTYRRAGYRAALVASAEKLIEVSPQRFFSPYHIANLFEFAGDRERAMEWLEKAYAERSPSLIWAAVSPAHRVLARDPRYRSLLRRMELPAHRL
jgi:eukaryotic-like serine/threonine-protein kinase